MKQKHYSFNISVRNGNDIHTMLSTAGSDYCKTLIQFREFVSLIGGSTTAANIWINFGYKVNGEYEHLHTNDYRNLDAIPNCEPDGIFPGDEVEGGI